MMNTRYLVHLFGIFMLSLLLVGCDSDDDDDDDDVESSTLRIINAISDAPALTLTVDDDGFDGTSFRQASNAYTTTDAETVSVSVFFTNEDGVLDSLIEDINVSIGIEEEVRIVLWGEFSSPQFSVLETPILTLEEDEDGDPIARDDLTVQVFNASNNPDAFDVYLTEYLLPIQDESPIATVATGQFSEPLSYIGDDDFQLQLTTPGTTSVVYDSGELNLPAGVNLMLLITDYFGPGEATARVTSIFNGTSSTLVNEDLPSDLRVMNFVTGINNIDVYFGNTNVEPAFGDVPYRGISEYRTFDPDQISINVTPGDDPLTFLYESDIALNAGEIRTLLIAGDPEADDDDDDAEVGARLILDDLRAVATELKVNFFNASFNIGAVDFYLLSPGQPLVDATPSASNAAFLSSTSIPTPPGTYDLLLTLEGQETVIAGPTRIAITEGFFITAILAESSSGGPPYELIVLEEPAE